MLSGPQDLGCLGLQVCRFSGLGLITSADLQVLRFLGHWGMGNKKNQRMLKKGFLCRCTGETGSLWLHGFFWQNIAGAESCHGGFRLWRIGSFSVLDAKDAMTQCYTYSYIIQIIYIYK